MSRRQAVISPCRSAMRLTIAIGAQLLARRGRPSGRAPLEA